MSYWDLIDGASSDLRAGSISTTYLSIISDCEPRCTRKTYRTEETQLSVEQVITLRWLAASSAPSCVCVLGAESYRDSGPYPLTHVVPSQREYKSGIHPSACYKAGADPGFCACSTCHVFKLKTPRTGVTAEEAGQTHLRLWAILL